MLFWLPAVLSADLSSMDDSEKKWCDLCFKLCQWVAGQWGEAVKIPVPVPVQIQNPLSVNIWIIYSYSFITVLCIHA